MPSSLIPAALFSKGPFHLPAKGIHKAKHVGK